MASSPAPGDETAGQTLQNNGIDESNSRGKEAVGRESSENSIAPKVSIPDLFRYADATDWILIVVGTVLSMGNGVILPSFAILFGACMAASCWLSLPPRIAVPMDANMRFDTRACCDLMDNLNDEDAVLDEVEDIALLFFILGLATLIGSYAEIAFFMLSADRQVKRVREAYLSSLLHQDMVYFDTHRTEEVAGRLAEDTINYQNGIAGKLGQAIHFSATFIGGVTVGFIIDWKLALVVCATTPLLVVGALVIKESTGKYQLKMEEAYSRAGAFASEAIANIRTVVAFGREATEVSRYAGELHSAEDVGIKKGFFFGLGLGVVFMSMFSAYGIGIWYGSTLIVSSREDGECEGPVLLEGDDCFTGGQVVQVFFAILIGSFSLGQVGPSLSALTVSQAAAANIFSVIDRVPAIDVSDPSGERVNPDALQGRIEFQDVTFAFPSRPHTTVLRNFSLVIEPGQTVALVGSSGSGKSTVVQLLQRFYDPQSGRILLDGKDIRTYNVASLRRAMGVVAQEPALFQTTVGENIQFGRSGEGFQVPSKEEVKEAAQAANAHQFIEQLQKGYGTEAGQSGSQLSGGQKQRVAIARALVRSPKILLLDEATAALDTESEKVVQRALDVVLADESTARTTLVIAHRLSTIRNADQILVLHFGELLERGTHSSLMENEDGHYRALYETSLVVEDVEVQEGDGSSAANTNRSQHDRSQGRTQRSLSSSSPRMRSVSGASALAPPLPLDRTLSGDRDAASDDDDDDEKEEEVAVEKQERQLYPPVPMARVWEYQREDVGMLAGALLFASINGAVMPAFALLFSRMFVSLYSVDNDVVESDSKDYLGALIGVGVLSLITQTLQYYFFGVLGERLTRRLRHACYRALLRQEVGFFDMKSHSTGRLASRLSGDAALVRATVGEKLGLLVQNVAALVFGLVVAFRATWELSLVILGTVPLMAVAGMLEGAVMTGQDDSSKRDQSYEEAGHHAVEAVANVRVVQAFGIQSSVLRLFSEALERAMPAARKRAHMAGLAFGFSQFMQFATYSVCFYVGGVLIDEGRITFEELFEAFFVLSMASYAIGSSTAMMTDQSKAEPAKRSIFALLDRRSAIDPFMSPEEAAELEDKAVGGSEEGRAQPGCEPALDPTGIAIEAGATNEGGDDVEANAKEEDASDDPVLRWAVFGKLPKILPTRVLDPSTVRGAIEFRDVTFWYPSRQSTPVLQNFNLTIGSGQTVAMVGPSGSGKSTVVQLMQRFYDPQHGSITLDGVDIREYTPHSLRSVMGLVQQEPNLFHDTVGYNIGYGQPVDPARDDPNVHWETPTDGTGEPSETVREAASEANALEFVEQFPQRFLQDVGRSGSQLSGGQKQRVSIARALVRNPKVLLLDEATSALDTQSEHVVQSALDALMQDPARHFTAVVVAHRLSTIRGADTICVLESGKLVEQGTHNELLAQGGLYRRLAVAGGDVDDE